MSREIAIALSILVLFLAGVVFLSIQEQREWEAFKQEHHCKLVAHISGDIFNTVGISGSGNMVVGVGSTPSKEGWQCDDGMTYYR